MSLRLLLADLLLASFAFKNKRFNSAILHAFRVHKISTVVSEPTTVITNCICCFLRCKLLAVLSITYINSSIAVRGTVR